MPIRLEQCQHYSLFAICMWSKTKKGKRDFDTGPLSLPTEFTIERKIK